MYCLAAVYEWQVPASAETANASSLPRTPCRCSERSPAELEVQQLKAKAELALLRDRVRKLCVGWLGEPQSCKSAAAPIRIKWQIEPTDLVRQLCYWQHTSALSKIAMTPCLAELTRQHRKLEGTSSEPPATKNKLTLVVWNLAATIQAKLRQWHACLAAKTKEAFVGEIVVRMSDLVPLWTWESDILRHRPALVEVCDRMLGMDLWQYRQRCNQLTKQEKKLARGGQIAPYLTPFGLRWPLVESTSNSSKAAGTSQRPTSFSAAAPATIRMKSRLEMLQRSMDSKPLNSSKRSMHAELVDLSNPSELSAPSFSEPSSLLSFSKSAKRPHARKPAASDDRPTMVFAGETFCVSGPFTIDQKAMLALISRHGGSTASTVTRSCTYLVADRLGSAKTRKAQANGIPVVTEAWIRTSIAEGKKSTDASLFANNCTSTSTSSSSCSNKHSVSSKVTRPTRDRDNDDMDDDDGKGEEDDDLDLQSGDESEQSESVSGSDSNSDSDLDSDVNSESDAERRSLDERSENDGHNNQLGRQHPSIPARTHANPRPHRSSFE